MTPFGRLCCAGILGLIYMFNVDCLDYLIYGKKTIWANSDYPVSVVCFNGSGDINVSVSLEADTKVISNRNGILRSNQLQPITLQVGNVTVPPDASLRIHVRGSDTSDFFDNSAAVSLDNVERGLKTFIFIQTDKPLYKAGDTVRFRVLTVNQQLLLVYSPLKIYVRDGQGNIVKQFLNASDPKVKGYFSGDVALSKDPVLGTWHIEAASIDKQVKQTKDFFVDEYVLPRFDVKIIAPDYVVATDSELKFAVEANYTFGEPVKGKLDVTVKGPQQDLFSSRFSSVSEKKIAEKYSFKEFNGRTTIVVPLRVLFNGTIYPSSRVEIQANFTEALTGAERNASTVSVPLKSDPFKLTVITKSSDIFLPGFPVTFRATLSDLAGRPLAPSTKSANITVAFFDKRASWGKAILGPQQTKENSSQPQPSDAVPDDVTPTPIPFDDNMGIVGEWAPWSQYSFRSRYSDIPKDVYNVSIPIDGAITFNIPTPKAARRAEIIIQYGKVQETLKLNGRESPSGSFIKVSALNTEIHAGDSIKMGINMTSHGDETLKYTVTSISNSSYYWSNSSVASGQYAEISVPAVEAMGASAKFIVYYIRSDGEVVAASTPIAISPSFKNKVAVSVKPELRSDYAEPGEMAVVRVETTPLAFVGLLAMDESLLLLKTGNDIAASDVNSAIDSDKDALTADSFSADDDFQKSALFLLTNKVVPTSFEKRTYSNHYSFRVRGVSRSSNAARGIASGLASASSSSRSTSWGSSALSARPLFSTTSAILTYGTTDKPSSLPWPKAEDVDKQLKQPTQLRKDFRESFLFETAYVSEKGVVEFKSKVPDTITQWRISAISLSESTGLGISEVPAQLKVFQPFFAVLNLPFSVIRGEKLSMDILVFNYMKERQNVSILLEITDANNKTTTQKKSVMAKPGEGSVATFQVTPNTIGDLSLKATVNSLVAADQIEKKLPVKPEGVRQYFNKPVFIDLRNTRDFSATVQLPPNPAGFVEGSERAEVKVVGDILGPAINNLDKLIRLPTGCGEQNMALTAPNIVVAKYLKVSNQMKPSQQEKLVANIRLGYQRELTYRHDDNSYSAWGKSDPKGSTWLTAYVARVFLEAKEFIDIEDDVVRTALRFLVDQQNENGSFAENGNIVDKQHQGGAASGVSLTAFTLLPFLKYFEGKEAKDLKELAVMRERVEKVSSYLESEVSKLSNDTYTLAITAYALALGKSEKAAEVLAELDKQATRNGSMLFWSTGVRPDDKNADSLAQFSTSPKDIEATAYALMAYVAADRTSEAFPIVSWLLSKQTSDGGFVSTQDTVVGLTALGLFASLNVEPPTMTVNIDESGQERKSISVTADNAVVLQTIEIAKKPAQVQLQASGKGVALAHVSWTYNVAKPKEAVAFDLNVTVSTSKTDLRAQICARYLRSGSSSMAVVELEALSGYQVDPDEVQKLVDSSAGLRKVEVENKDTKLVTYFDELSGTPTCFKVTLYRIFKVADLKAQSVVVYDYYNPKDRKTVSYTFK